MNNKFLCAEVFVTYPDMSKEISALMSQSGLHSKIEWENIRKFISEGNLIFIVQDMDINCNYEGKIVAVAFYSFSKKLFDDFICLEDVFIDKNYKNCFLHQYFWDKIKDKSIFGKVKKFFSKEVDILQRIISVGCFIEFIQIIEPSKKPF